MLLDGAQAALQALGEVVRGEPLRLHGGHRGAGWSAAVGGDGDDLPQPVAGGERVVVEYCPRRVVDLDGAAAGGETSGATSPATVGTFGSHGWVEGNAWIDAVARPARLAYSSPVPRKVRELVGDLVSAGFAEIAGGKGSHRKYTHPRFPGAVTLSGALGEDAKPYQEKQVRRAIEKVEK